MKKGECFSCGEQGHWSAECPKKSTSFSQPNPNTTSKLASVGEQGYSEPTRMKKGDCFSCGEQGHWAAECPTKSTSFSQPNPNTTSRLASVREQGHSEIICQCGAGVCQPRVAKTNGKVYYRCPAESWMRCDFFMWQFKSDSSSVKRLQYPICDCGAGVCVLAREAATGREYFKCRVPKGHGACSFRQWLDAPVSYTKNVTVETYDLSTQTLGKQVNHPLFEEDDYHRKCMKITELDGSPNTNTARFSPNSTASFMSSDTKKGFVMSAMDLDELLGEITEYDYTLTEDGDSSCKSLKMPESEENSVNTSAQVSPNSSISLGSSSGKEILMENATDLKQFDADKDLVNEAIAFESTINDVDERVRISYDSQMEEVVETDLAKLHNIVQFRQVNFERRIVAAATELPPEKCISVTLGAQYLGWLSRFAFAYPRCLILPLDKSWFCCIFPNFDPIYVPQGLGQFEDTAQTVSNSVVGKSLTVPQESVVEDVPASILKEQSAPGSPPYVSQPDNAMAAAILEAFGQAALLIQTNFIIRLESMNPPSHELMAKEANTVFAGLDHLKIDYRPFRQRVRDFIDAAASLTQIELSFCNDALLQDTLDHYNQEKLRLEQLSSEHSSVMNSFTRSQERVQSLLNEAEEVRNRLLQIEQQVSTYQLGTIDLNIRLAELSAQINECEDRLQSASLEAAHKFSMQKEAERSAAWDVFEKAKFQLRDRAS